MSTFEQTPDGDLAINVGRFTIVKGQQEKAQKIQNRFRLFKDEWFLDTRLGTPWFSVVFVKDPDIELVKRLFRKVILSVTGIVDVREISVDWDREERHLSYSYVAIDEEGNEISGSSEEPFIVRIDG